MENFNIITFLTENKITEQSKKLNEVRGHIELAGDFEGSDFDRKMKRRADDFEFIPQPPIVVDEINGVADSFYLEFEIKLSNGDEIYFLSEGAGDRRPKRSIEYEIRNKKLKNPGNIADEVGQADAPVLVALDFYKKLYKANF